MKHVETINLPFDLNEFTEIIDVRSPGEFEQDHLPGAINLPLLDNAQRQEIGTTYRSNAFQARRLGAQLIAHKASQYLEQHFAEKDRDYTPLIYCWRGGMRSNAFAHILRQIGWRARVLDGGYKVFRKFVCSALEEQFTDPRLKLIVLTGQTGVAKTRLLHTLKHQGFQVLDLEGLANHKGSVLGQEPDTKQPGQKHFETLIWQTIQKFDFTQPIFTEAESNRIGKLHCPPVLWKRLGQSEVIEIRMPLQRRAAFLLDDYPYFIENPEHLKKLLAQLTRLRGHKKIEQWHHQIDTGAWQDFVESILRDHYDLVYRKAGDTESNYPPPLKSIDLDNYSQSSLEHIATSLARRA